MEKFTVSPWKVVGEVDYNKLIEYFGTKPITKEILEKLKKHKELHVMLRREFYFSHRDLDLILKDYESGRGFFLYTGLAPSGEMHIGHLLSFYMIKWFQEVFKVNVYIQVPDEEKFLARDIALGSAENLAEKGIENIAALGFDPNRTFIFRDTEYIKHLYKPAIKIAKRINFSTARAVFGFDNQTNVGLAFYPALQIVPTFFEKSRCLIPAGIDQDPYWRVQRDIAEVLGYKKAAAIHSKFLPPLTGPAGKMSASKTETAIFLSDSPDTVKNKIIKYAFSGGAATTAEHRKSGGNPDVDVAFQWLHILFEENDKKIEQIRQDYKSGQLLTGELKQILIEKLNKFLESYNKQKKQAKNPIKKYMHEGKLAKKMWDWEDI